MNGCDVHDEQRLEPPHGAKPGVREAHATDLALPAHLPPSGASYVAREHPTYH
jgi:hypothetical protein